MSHFDDVCAEFTQTMRAVADWKHTYHGAAYTTRLTAAIAVARRMSAILHRMWLDGTNFRWTEQEEIAA